MPAPRPPPARHAPASAPSYPAAAGGAGGQAVVDCVIATDGFAHDCRIVASDVPALGQAVLTWLTGPNPPHFEPAMRDGIAVAVPHRWAIYFQPQP